MTIAIEVCGNTVAITKNADVVTRLNTDPILRNTVRSLRPPFWNGTSPFISRPATPEEARDYCSWLAVSGGLPVLWLTSRQAAVQAEYQRQLYAARWRPAGLYPQAS